MKERWNGFICGFNCDSGSDAIAAENVETSYVFKLDIPQFAQLGDGVVSNFRRDDQLN
jgi:hypothetical protein